MDNQAIKGDPAMPRCGSRCLHHQGHPGDCALPPLSLSERKAVDRYWMEWAIEEYAKYPRKRGRRRKGQMCPEGTIDDIAEKAGVARRTIYKWRAKEYPTKRRHIPEDKKALQQVTRTVRLLRKVCSPDLWKHLSGNPEALSLMRGALRAADQALPPEPRATTEAERLAAADPSGPAISGVSPSLALEPVVTA